MIRLTVYGFLILGVTNIYLLGEVFAGKVRDQIRRDNITYYSGISDVQIAPIDLELKRVNQKLEALKKAR